MNTTDTLSRIEACRIAGEHARAKGFSFVSGSMQSEAAYYRLDGRAGQLRIAAHECRHPFDVVESLEFIYAEAWQRDADDLGLCPEQVIELTEWAIERFMESAEADDDGE